MPHKEKIQPLLADIGACLSAQHAYVTTAESCTGGAVAEAMTALPGSSGWFDRGFVTYSNAAKIEMLHVSPVTLATHGAVSEPVVIEMALGALQYSHAHWALAVSGIAGPGGGSAEKPVGTVCFAWAGATMQATASTQHFAGNRYAVRDAAVFYVLEKLRDYLRK